MPFGLHSTAATWLRFADAALKADLEERVFIYLDDVIICSKYLREACAEGSKRAIAGGWNCNGGMHA